MLTPLVRLVTAQTAAASVARRRRRQRTQRIKPDSKVLYKYGLDFKEELGSPNTRAE